MSLFQVPTRSLGTRTLLMTNTMAAPARMSGTKTVAGLADVGKGWIAIVSSLLSTCVPNPTDMSMVSAVLPLLQHTRLRFPCKGAKTNVHAVVQIGSYPHACCTLQRWRIRQITPKNAQGRVP